MLAEDLKSECAIYKGLLIPQVSILECRGKSGYYDAKRRHSWQGGARLMDEWQAFITLFAETGKVDVGGGGTHRFFSGK